MEMADSSESAIQLSSEGCGKLSYKMLFGKRNIENVSKMKFKASDV